MNTVGTHGGSFFWTILYLSFLTQDLSVSQKLIAGQVSDSTDELRGSAGLLPSQCCGDRHAWPYWVFTWVLEFWIQALEIPQQVLSWQAISLAPGRLFYILPYFHRVWAVILISRLAWKLGHRISLVSSQTILKPLSIKKRILRTWGRSPPWSSMTCPNFSHMQRPMDKHWRWTNWWRLIRRSWAQTCEESALLTNDHSWISNREPHYLPAHNILQWHPSVSVPSEATVSIIPITSPFFWVCVYSGTCEGHEIIGCLAIVTLPLLLYRQGLSLNLEIGRLIPITPTSFGLHPSKVLGLQAWITTPSFLCGAGDLNSSSKAGIGNSLLL